MAIDNTASSLKKQIEAEISQYLTEVVSIGDNYDYSQHKLVRRIALFENHVYPTGKFDSQGNYKLWFDLITPRIDAEVKNVDFDSKSVIIYSPRKSDELPAIISNLKLKDYLKETGQGEEINSAIEEGAGWGNVVWKKVKKSYERVDLRNFYVINQTAFSLDDTPVIERHQFTQSDLRAMSEAWENIPDVIEQCGSNSYKAVAEGQEKDTTVPYYEIFERNGEVCLYDLKETQGKKPKEKDKDKYVHAKIIAAGKKSQATGVAIVYILFAEETKKKNSDIYKEYHRGRYKGRWFREGLYELLFDCQVRGNEIGNQIARGLEYASKRWFTSEDKLVVQNVMTDMKNGDILRTKGLTAVETRMEGFDQLVAEYNRIIGIANDIANSREVVQGDSLPSGTPFRMGALLNQNANKLFDFIREKLAIPLSEIFEEWIVPELVKDLKAQDVLRLTGDSDMLKRFMVLIVDDWYVQNLVAIGPHTPEMAQALKEQKLQELMQRPQILVKGIQQLFKDFAPHVCVDITGEGLNLDADVETLGQLANMEQDPVRRSAMIELIARKKGVDLGSLPKMPPQPVQSPMQPQQKQKQPA